MKFSSEKLIFAPLASVTYLFCWHLKSSHQRRDTHCLSHKETHLFSKVCECCYELQTVQLVVIVVVMQLEVMKLQLLRRHVLNTHVSKVSQMFLDVSTKWRNTFNCIWRRSRLLIRVFFLLFVVGPTAFPQGVPLRLSHKSLTFYRMRWIVSIYPLYIKGGKDKKESRSSFSKWEHPRDIVRGLTCNACAMIASDANLRNFERNESEAVERVIVMTSIWRLCMWNFSTNKKPEIPCLLFHPSNYLSESMILSNVYRGLYNWFRDRP